MKVCQSADKCRLRALEGEVFGKKPMKKQPCRGVFTEREPMRECIILSERDALQLIGGTGARLRD
jgi:hypothetical protein